MIAKYHKNGLIMAVEGRPWKTYAIHILTLSLSYNLPEWNVKSFITSQLIHCKYMCHLYTISAMNWGGEEECNLKKEFSN